MAGGRASPARFGDVRRVAETGSTNADVLTIARAGAPEGVVLVADHQTAGRGRHGRTWVAPAGASLLVSVLLRPSADVAPLCTFAAGLAMCEAVHAVAGFAPRVKWPNDLVVEDRKLAGLLAESDWSDAGQPAVVVGVGVNVNWPAQLPADLRETAIAINHVAGRDVDREQLLVEWLRQLDVRYPPNPTVLLEEWRARSATLGRRVRVELEGSAFEGDAVDVTREGHLVVDARDRLREVTAGDVVHLRSI